MLFSVLKSKHLLPLLSFSKRYASTISNTMAKLTISPSAACVTEEIKISGEGFEPHSLLTVQATLLCPSENLNFQSYSYISASSEGSFDLTKNVSVGGTYNGIDGMGLFWTMQQQTETYHDNIHMTNAHIPLEYKFNVFSGHVDNFDIEIYKISSATCIRYFTDDNVTREHIRSGHIKGTLFTPKKKGPFPAIITIYGGNKRKQEIEDDAALLANHGFVTLALAFFGVDDLPKYTHGPLRIEYFEEAVTFLSLLPQVIPSQIGVYGSSKGGDIALSMMSHIPQIKVVCVFNACISSTGTDTIYNGKSTPALSIDLQHIVSLPDGVISIKKILCNPLSEADIAKEKMDAVGKRNYKIIKYSDMGHRGKLAPFTPGGFIGRHPLFPKGLKVLLYKKMHVHYRGEAWKEIFLFFKKSFARTTNNI